MMAKFKFKDINPSTHEEWEWEVRVIERGYPYGLEGCLIHGKFDPLVEFWYEKFFVSRYYLSTMLERHEGGLLLYGSDYKWSISDGGMTKVRAYLISKQ